MSSFKPSRPPKAQNTVSKTDEGHYFEVIPTPSPRELAFRVKEACATFNPTEVPAIGTTYGDSSFLSVRPRIQLEGFKDYLLLNVQREGEFLWFKYAKNKTEEEKNNSPFCTFFTTRRYTWPAILQDLYFVQTSALQQSQPAYYPRYTFRPATSVSTICMVEQFLSPTPWDRTLMTHQQPLPTGVHGSWVGLEFDFQECLHPDVVVTEKVPNFTVVFGVGVLNPVTPRDFLRKIIPKTNFTSWAPFVYDDSAEPSDGYWLRERVTYYPPILPRATSV